MPSQVLGFDKEHSPSFAEAPPGELILKFQTQIYVRKKNTLGELRQMLRGEVRQKMKASARTRVVQVVREGDEDERLMENGGR
jgi:hypothetical protein